MKTSVIGFPRVGTLRELKFASEKYFRKETGAEELLKEARRLRKTHWTVQKEAEIDYIPCNDFSFYDTVLDTAVLLGIVPKRYQELNLSALDTYFAMARGYQGESGDVKALAMKNGLIQTIIILCRKQRTIQRLRLWERSCGKNMRKQRHSALKQSRSLQDRIRC